MKSPTRGVMFFNFGNKCVARLLTAIYTLKRVYTGPITVALAKNDETNKELEKLFIKDNINILWFDFESKVKRNLKSILKPYLFSISPYDTTLLFDGDLIFIKPIDELWEKIEDKGFLVTHFCNWYSHGSTMTKRIKILESCFNEKQMKASLDKHPAVNIGVLGYSRGKGDKLLRKWDNVTKQVAGKFIADEIAMQGVYFWYDHYLANETFNYSCHYGSNFKDVHIIHYHGNKHTSPKRFSSRLWWGFVQEMKCKGIDIDKWLQFDHDAKQVINSSDSVFLKSCFEELDNLLRNNIEKKQEDEIIESESDAE